MPGSRHFQSNLRSSLRDQRIVDEMARRSGMKDEARKAVKRFDYRPLDGSDKTWLVSDPDDADTWEVYHSTGNTIWFWNHTTGEFPLGIRRNGRLAADLEDNTIDFNHVRFDAIDDYHIFAGAVTDIELDSNAAGSDEIQTGAVGSSEISDGLKGGSFTAHRLREIAGAGTDTRCASANHNHSVGFKSDFSQEQRKEFLSDLHVLESKQNPSALERMVIRLSRMQCDDADMSAEELVTRIDKLDDPNATEEEQDFAHEWRYEHERDYHARWRYEHDPRYREEMADKPQIQKSLGRFPKSKLPRNKQTIERALERRRKREEERLSAIRTAEEKEQSKTLRIEASRKHPRRRARERR